jgi:hypothetical protein
MPNILTKERLGEDVDNLFSEILNDKKSDKFRCHEIARLMRNGLAKEGYQNPVVRDGKAVYDMGYLKNLLFEGLELDGEPMKETDKEINWSNKEMISVIHSWCEVDGFVIDHHNTLRPDRNTVYEMLTIIDRKENLDGKVFYDCCGKVYRFLRNNFLFIPPQYLTRIRV